MWRSIADCHQPENTKFIAAANPAAVLALIAEVEGLRAQHGRDSAELRRLSQARDDARKEHDQLKAEIERLTADNASLRGSCAKLGVEHAGMVRIHRKANTEIRRLSAEVAALRKDAELHQQIQRAANDLPSGWDIRVCVERESGYVELWDQDGCEVDFPNSCESLALTVSDAIDAAMSNKE